MNRVSRLWAWVLVLLACLAVPGAAHARTWVEGTASQPFSGDERYTDAAEVRGAYGVRLLHSVMWEYRRPGTAPFEPFSAQELDNGNVLIASRSNEVLEVTRSKRLVWSYTLVDDDAPFINVYSAERLPNGNTLVVDRRADLVIEVNKDKDIVRRYGGSVVDTTAPGGLMDPFSAMALDNGNWLIVDNRDACRVIEVRMSDYDPDVPNYGFTASSIVWQYGTAGVAGIGPNELISPRHATKLASGNYLITDSSTRDASGDRVIEVSPGKEIVWQFGVAGEGGRDETHLMQPSAAYRLANGNTLIAEEDGQRIVEVTPDKRMVEWYGRDGLVAANGGALSTVRNVFRTAAGTNLVCDQGNERVVEIGYARKGTFTSQQLYLGLPGVKKLIRSIKVDAELPAQTAVKVFVSLDGGSWKQLPSSGALPAGSTATQVRYRLELSTAEAYTPLVKTVTFGYDVSTASDDGESGGTGGTKSPTSTTSGTGSSSSTGGGGATQNTKSTGGSGSGASKSALSGTQFAQAPGDIDVTPYGADSLISGTVLNAAVGTTSGGGPSGVATGSSGGAMLLVGLSYLAGLSAAAVSTSVRNAQGALRVFGRSSND